MDTRHLEFFVAVAEELSFTRAAVRLDATQSTVSAGVRSLELQLRGSVFVRTTRSVQLTPLGMQALPVARQALAAVGELHGFAAATTGTLRGRVRLGIITNLEWLDVPSVLGEFRARHPLVDLSMSVSPRGSSGLLADLRLGRLDLVFCGVDDAELADLHHRRLSVQPYVAVLPAAHRWSGRDGLTLAELVDEPFVELPAGFGTRQSVDRVAGVATRRRIAVEVPDLAAVPAYVRAGFGVAVVPVPVEDMTGVVCVPMLDLPPWELSIAARATARGPVVEALVEQIVRAADAHDVLI